MLMQPLITEKADPISTTYGEPAKIPDIVVYNPSQALLHKMESKYAVAEKKPRANHTTDPIKSNEDIQRAKDYFLAQPQAYRNHPDNIRNYALFTFGINCARRIGDMLAMRLSDVLNPDLSFKSKVKITEQKTQKFADVPINSEAREALQLYFESRGIFSSKPDLSEPVFKSRKKRSMPKALAAYEEACKTGDESKIQYAAQRVEIAYRYESSIEPRSAWRIMKQMSRAIGLEQKGIHVGCHTLRKTPAYQYYRKTHDIRRTAEMLNHEDTSSTMHYIDVTPEEYDEMFLGLDYSTEADQPVSSSTKNSPISFSFAKEGVTGLESRKHMITNPQSLTIGKAAEGMGAAKQIHPMRI